MAKISTYPVDTTINGLDILIGSDADDLNITKNYRIDSIRSYVLSSLNLSVAPVLQSVSTNDQVPVGTDNPLQVTFGPAQGTPSDPVQLLATGEIVFNQSGLYLFNGYANFDHRAGSNNVAVIAFRGLLNGVQITPTKAVLLEKAGDTSPYELTVPIQVNAGDVLTWEIMRDSAGIDAGGLYTIPLGGPWTDVPSTDVNVWKVGI